MNRVGFGKILLLALLVLSSILSCTLGSAISPPTASALPPPAGTTEAVAAPSQAATGTVEVVHAMVPSSPPSSGQLIYDVISQDTAPEKRAPYGDSYDINRLERPFMQDMTYEADLDIWSFSVASDADWWYVSIRLIGTNPNNPLGPQYGVELDLDHDGFGDYAIETHSPISAEWETAPVQIYQDKNHDTGGLSAEKSDAPISTDGYETLIFNGGQGDTDADLAWVRLNAGELATLQFAFKKAWAGSAFMLGTFADAGLKDVGKLDYVDRFTLIEAGSPVRSNTNYPLKALFAFDNTCRQAFGFIPTGYEPQLCPTEPPATSRPRATGVPSGQPPPEGCPDPGNCPYGWAGEPYCYCIPG